MTAHRLVILLLFTLLTNEGFGQQASESTTKGLDLTAVTITDIIDVWERSSRQASTAAYWWTEEETFRDPESDDGARAEFVTKMRKNELYMGADSAVRYVRRGHFWESFVQPSQHFAGVSPGYYQYSDTATYDGSLGMNLLSDGYPGLAKWGYVGAGYKFYDSFATLPVVLAHRPFSFGVVDAFNISEWIVAGSDHAAGGEPCVLIESHLSPKGRVLRMRLDPSRDYVPLEIQQLFNDVLMDHIVVTYAPSREASWQCTGWKVTRWHLESGELNTASSVKVDRVAFGDNAPRVAFSIEFGRGTIIQDSRDQTITVIRNDGRTKRFSENDSRVATGDLDVGKSDRIPILYMFAACVALIICVSGIVWWRQLRR